MQMINSRLPLVMPRYVSLSGEAKAGIHILFIAKHVFWQGGLHHTDGNHAPYHREMRTALESARMASKPIRPS